MRQFNRIAPYLTAVLTLASLGFYLAGVATGAVNTALTTWLVLTASSAMNLAILWWEGQRDLRTNAYLVTGLGGAVFIIVTCIITESYGTLRLLDGFVLALSTFGFTLFIVTKRKHRCFRCS